MTFGSQEINVESQKSLWSVAVNNYVNSTATIIPDTGQNFSPTEQTTEFGDGMQLINFSNWILTGTNLTAIGTIYNRYTGLGV